MLSVLSYQPMHVFLDQIVTLALVILLWLTMGRFKRVEVQVVQDERETTYGIFKKLQVLSVCKIIFILAILCF